MTEKEAINRINEKCFTNDHEHNRTMANYILREFVRELGYKDLINVYASVDMKDL